MNSAVAVNELSPIMRAILARFEGLPFKLSIAEAAILLGEKPKTAAQQIYRRRGLFFRIAREIDGTWHVPLANVMAVAMGELKVAEKRKVGRPPNKDSAAAARKGG